MFRTCVLCLFVCVLLASPAATEQIPSAAIQATATVVQPVGFSTATDPTAPTIRVAGRELPLTSEAFRVHRLQREGASLFYAPTVCVHVESDGHRRTVTLIPTAN